MNAEVEVNAVGISTVEAVPLFHYKPGGLAARLIVYPSKWLKAPCSAPFEPCEWLTAPRSFTGFLVKVDAIRQVVSRWKTDVVVLDGVETWRFTSSFKGLGPLAARTQLLIGEPLLEGLDVIIIDLAPERLNAEMLRAVAERALLNGVWVEANLYLEEPSQREAMEAARALRGLQAPLHVHILDHKGGAPVRRLYLALTGVHWPVYIHADVYSEIDTKCPRCGTYVATRHKYTLTSLALTGEGRCPSCHARLPFKPPLRRKTDVIVARTMGSTIIYIDPRVLGGRLATSSRQDNSL